MNAIEPDRPADAERDRNGSSRSGGSSAAEQDAPTSQVGREPRLADLSTPAAERIRRFVAESTLKGGASPADVADLYTSPEIVADAGATGYLDRRYVDGEMPSDWRELQDQLSEAQRGAPAGLTAEALLARSEPVSPWGPGRSIFDDPEDLDEADDDRGDRLTERDPTLADLLEEGRQAIERHILAEVFGYGMAPIHTMQLRERLDDAGDERSLQYFDLPFEQGERPADWDTLRDRALRLRARLESQRRDPTALFWQVARADPGLAGDALLTQLEALADRG